ncbi:MAG: transposase [Sphingomicrobium sp.]
MLDDEISFETSEPPVVRRMEVVTGACGRRRWTPEAKARIIAESLMPGANVAEVARRHGLIAQQLYGWRSLARAREDMGAMGFVPVALDGSRPDGAGSPGWAGQAEIVVRTSGMAVHIPAGVRADHIERVLLAVRGSA